MHSCWTPRNAVVGAYRSMIAFRGISCVRASLTTFSAGALEHRPVKPI
ncbi:hypothetical protein EKH55_5471 [Sinorhizobium alkalisoli]|nr:hypothetical protein EKH55_5471 [Sinorhizobium alkalisoli]